MTLRGADLVARTLVAAGVKRVFTLSGNHVMPIFDAALDAKLELVHVRHEAAAVHMADAWGRLTGEPGVALVTGGPGHANAVSALYTALEADSPVLLLSGHAPLGELGKGAFQEMRQADIAAPLCKASWAARSAASLGEELARAWRTARSGRPGPVHLSLPNDVLDEKADARVPAAQEFEVGDRIPDRRALEAIVQAVRQAKKPVILGGPAMVNARGKSRMRRLEEATGAPVIGMESPRGVRDPSLGKLSEILGKADVAVLLGKRLDYTLRFGGAFAKDCRVVEAPQDLDVPASSEALVGLFAGSRAAPSGWLEEARAALAYRPAAWAGLRSKAEGPLHPAELCRAVQKLLEPREAVLVCDGGEFGQWAQACLSAPVRLINGPAGSIGSALPFAAAAKLAAPSSRVVAMLGDGTFGFHMAEIETAARCKLDYLAVVGSDGCWNAEHQIQLRAYGEARAHGLALLPSRYGAAAAALGAHGEDLARPDELAPALERARASGRVACVNAGIERLPAPVY